MAKPGLHFNADLTEAFGALGALTGVLHTVKSQRYLGNMIKYAHDEMSKEFDTQLHLKAGVMRERFNHVYEWGMIGLPEGKLWQHSLSGRGAERVAGFTFMASKKPIPSPEERAKDSGDPMSSVPPEVRARLSKRRYVFYWKAPIMEYRMNVTIVPKHGRFLFIPSFRQDKGYLFHPGPVNLRAGSSNTAGAFTAEFIDFFSGPGQEIAGERVNRMVQAEAEQAVGKRPRTKSFSIKAANSNTAAFEAGRQSAERFMQARAERMDDGSEL
jgi:hypothetical protein